MDIQKISCMDCRLGETFKLFKNNFGKYLGYNIVVFFIRYILMAILIFLGLLLAYLFMQNLNFDFQFGNQGGFFYFVVITLFFVILAVWIVSVLFFLINFYLTKKLIGGEKVSLLEGLKWMIANIWNKILVDMWYGLYMLIPIFIFFFGISFSFLLKPFVPEIVFNILWGIVIGISVGVFIYLLMVLSFAPYHCFEKNSFFFSTFKETFSFTKGKFWQILGNMLVLTIILQVIYFFMYIILQVLGLGILESNIQALTANIDFGNITKVNDKVMLGLFFLLLYYLIQQLIKLILDIYYFIYWYFYYKYLVHSYYVNGFDSTSANS